MNSKYVVLTPEVGDTVTFYVNAPLQNIGTTLVPRTGVVTKTNPKTFKVKVEAGSEYTVGREWYKTATHIPTIVKKEIN